MVATALHLFATTSMGIFMATVALSMPRFGMLVVLVLVPLEMLSGGSTPRESMPQFVQNDVRRGAPAFPQGHQPDGVKLRRDVRTGGDQSGRLVRPESMTIR